MADGAKTGASWVGERAQTGAERYAWAATNVVEALGKGETWKGLGTGETWKAGAQGYGMLVMEAVGQAEVPEEEEGEVQESEAQEGEQQQPSQT